MTRTRQAEGDMEAWGWRGVEGEDKGFGAGTGEK